MAHAQDQKIGLFMATVAGVNAMIGASIFINPAHLQLSVGPAAIITYVGVVVAVWIMALALARVAALYPQEGAFYTYARTWGGHTMGIIASGAYIMGLTLAMGLLTRIIANYLLHYFPTVPHAALGLATLWTLVVLNMLGATLTHIGQIILVALTIIPVIIITGLSLSKADVSNLTPFMPYGWSSLLAAIKAVLFGFFGFETAASLYSLVHKPEQNVPRAITYSIVIVGLVYITFISSIFLGLPASLFTSSEVPLSQVLLAQFPQYTWLVDFIHISIIVTILGTLHALIWSLGELFCATTRRMHLGFTCTLRQAVVVIGAIVTANFLFFKNIDLFFNLTALFLVFSYGSSIMALIAGPAKKTRSTLVLGYAGLLVALFIFCVALLEIINL